MIVDVFCCFLCIIVNVAVTLALKASSDRASVVVAGRLFHNRAVLGRNECACASTREWGMWYLWFAW